MKQLTREDFGMTDKGAVTLIEIGGTPGDNGEPTAFKFQVRHGVRTVGEFDSYERAREVAQAIVG